MVSNQRLYDRFSIQVLTNSNFLVVIAAAILFFVKTAAGACGFAPAWFGWKGLVTRGTESTSDRAWHGSSSLGALALAMPKLRPPPPAYIYPPSYTPPMPPSEMQPMAVSLERGGAAPSTQGHSLP